jgi:hypothetical protein
MTVDGADLEARRAYGRGISKAYPERQKTKRQTWHNGEANDAPTRKDLHPRACAHCGHTYNPRSGSVRYCSDDCRQATQANKLAAWRARGPDPAGAVAAGGS